MRIYLLWALIFGCAVYAWRNWFVSACVLILLSVVMQRQDFPSYLLGINGLNPWNLLFLATMLAWIVHRLRARAPFDLPRSAGVLLIVFFFLIFVAYLRVLIDFGALGTGVVGTRGAAGQVHQSFASFTGEFLINRLKFVLPALLLFDACRTRRRLLIAAGVILFSAVAYALLTIKFVPVSTAFTDSAAEVMRYRYRLDREIGLHAVDMSMLLGGGFWAMVAFTALAVRRRGLQIMLLGPLAAVFLGMVLCHSRGSYVAFAVAGLVLAAARWRKLLLLLPVLVAIVFVAMPAIPARLGMGTAVINITGEQVQDMDVMTAGRITHIWPPAFDQIAKAPLLGFGGLASDRTELRDRWIENGTGGVGHPHNAYLEILLDMGVVGLLPVLALYGGIFVMTLRLFRNRDDRVAAAIGGMGLACITTLLVTALGAQTFYPEQSALPYWCFWALALRVTVDRSRASSAALVRKRFSRPVRRIAGPLEPRGNRAFARQTAEMNRP